MSKYPKGKMEEKIRWIEKELEQLKICSTLLPIQDENYKRLQVYIRKKEDLLKKLNGEKEGECEF